MSRRWLGWGLAAVAASIASVRMGHPTGQPKDRPPMTAHTSHRPNRLIHERSPYLQQHAYNPVDWHPWGAEAFEQAKREDKPVFLSIGYSTCYWCHVMEEESFENPAIAQLINDSCVPVKVDREERPDIDSVYMIAVQAMSGQGGWPMTVFLTPEGKPFWGGTYVPPEDRDGRPGMPRLVQAIAEAWKTNRPQLLASSESVANALQAQAPPAAAQPVTVELLSAAVAQLTTQFDPTFAGFGDAPKFPRSHTLSMLLRVWRRQPDAHVLQMVEATLQAMAAGGIHDHLGGGFHRYSTDAQWLVPHFEKMLYDQALLARTYVEAYQATGKAEYAEAARDIFDYVLRDLRDPAGGFYSAEDAGGVGREGEYYVWSLEEIQRTLGQLAADRFARVYGVTAEGNFAPPHHGDGAAGPPKNVLHRARSVEVAASELGVTPAALQENLAADRAKLLAARGQRPRPHRDEKVLTDWNGLMIGALAYGGRALDEPRYIRAAEQAAAFVEQQLQRDGRLLHRWRERQADIPAFLDDYAFLSDGLVDLYEATFDPRWLAQAAALTESMVQLFWDEPAGGFWFSGAQNETLIARTKELYDGALPSGNSVAATVLVRLGRLTQRRAWLDRAERLFGAFSAALQQMPSAFPQCLIAIDGWLGPSQEIVIAGDPAAAGTREMIRLVHRRFLPRAGLALHPTGPAAARIESLIPFLASQPPIDGRPTAYVCRDYVCGLPATDVAALGQRLDQSAR